MPCLRLGEFALREKKTFIFLQLGSLFFLLASCQREIQPPPAYKQCASGETQVGNACTRDPSRGLNGAGRDRSDDMSDIDNGLGGTPTPSGTPKTDPDPPNNSPDTSKTEPEVAKPAPTSDSPKVLSSDETTDTAAGKSVDPTTISTLKDLQIFVSMKSVSLGGQPGPMVLFVKASQPSSIDQLSIFYNAGEVLEAEAAFDPWDINAKIEFKAGRVTCIVSETKYDWASYRPTEDGMGKSVPFACKSP